MTARKLQYYLMNSGYFKHEPCYMVEIDGDKIYNMIPVSYKQIYESWRGQVTIDIITYRHSINDKYVKFTFGGNNLYGCHKLKDLDFITLYNELVKFISNDEFERWGKAELRNYKIENIL